MLIPLDKVSDNHHKDVHNAAAAYVWTWTTYYHYFVIFWLIRNRGRCMSYTGIYFFIHLFSSLLDAHQ